MNHQAKGLEAHTIFLVNRFSKKSIPNRIFLQRESENDYGLYSPLAITKNQRRRQQKSILPFGLNRLTGRKSTNRN